jgi:hypothetical protein
MLGASIALKHAESRERFRDYLAEVERERMVSIALATRPQGRKRVAAVRGAIVAALRGAGSWKLSGTAPDAYARPAS